MAGNAGAATRGNGHGARDQVAVSKQRIRGQRTTSKPNACLVHTPVLCDATYGFVCALSTSDHGLCPMHSCKHPKPTRPLHYVHREERVDHFMPNSPTSGTWTTEMSERTFQDEGCNDPRKKPAKQWSWSTGGIPENKKQTCNK